MRKLSYDEVIKAKSCHHPVPCFDLSGHIVGSGGGGGWLSGGFTPCRHLRPSSGREHTIVTYSVR